MFNSYLIQDASYLLFGLLVIFLSVSHDVDVDGEGGVDVDVDGEGGVDHKVYDVFLDSLVMCSSQILCLCSSWSLANYGHGQN